MVGKIQFQRHIASASVGGQIASSLSDCTRLCPGKRLGRWAFQPRCRLVVTGHPSDRRKSHTIATFFTTRADAPGLHHISGAKRDKLRNLLAAAELAQLDGVTANSHSEQDRYWRYYCQFAHDFDLNHDLFLRNLDERDRCRIMGAFAAAYRDGEITGNKVQSGTVRKALDAVAAEFRANQRPSPVHQGDVTGNPLEPTISRQLKGYKNLDPGEKHQKALPILVYRVLARNDYNDQSTALHQLFRGAFFYAMRSCEYLEVRGERRTKRLVLANIRFLKGRREIAHTSHELDEADAVVITFTFQKNNERDDDITQWRSHDPTMCPYSYWAALVQRILSYSGTGPTTPVNTYEDANGQIKLLTA